MQEEVDGLQVLSLGTNRGLWPAARGAEDDTPARLAGYAGQVGGYHVIVHSLRGHGLRSGVRFAERGWAVPTNAFSRLDSLFRMVAHGIRLRGRARFDLVQAQEPLLTGVAGYVLSRLFRKPLSVCVYGSNPFDPNWVRESRANRLLAPAARWILHHAEGVQVDGSMTARSLEAAGVRPERIVLKALVPANMDAFVTARRDPEIRARLTDGGRFDAVALFIGRVVPQKNLGLLLDVAERTADVAPRLRFVIVGDGASRAALEQECARRGLGGRVAWEGARSHAEIPGIIAAADLFVLPSNYEGFPRVLMETAAAGLPIVTTAVSGSDDAVIDGHNGYVVPVGDAPAFADRVVRLAADLEGTAAMGARGRERMAELARRDSDPALQRKVWERFAGAGPGASPAGRTP